MTNVNLIYGNYAAIRQPELQCASSTKLIHLPLNSYIQMKLSLKKKKYMNRDLDSMKQIGQYYKPGCFRPIKVIYMHVHVHSCI